MKVTEVYFANNDSIRLPGKGRTGPIDCKKDEDVRVEIDYVRRMVVVGHPSGHGEVSLVPFEMCRQINMEGYTWPSEAAVAHPEVWDVPQPIEAARKQSAARRK